MRYCKNSFKKVISLFLVFTMLVSIWGSVAFTTDASDASETPSYTVEMSGSGDWALTNLKESTGPVRITYTVDSCTVIESGKYNDFWGVIATKTPKANFSYSGGGVQRTPGDQSVIMQPGYSYSFEISVNGSQVLYAGSYTDATGNEGKITFAGQYGTPDGTEKHFGLYVGPTTTAKLVNVTCVDAKGNNLGLQSNRALYIAPETDEQAYAVSIFGQYSVALVNKKTSTGPINLSYTVEYYSQTSSTKTNAQGVLSNTSVPSGNYPYTGMNYTNSTDMLMKPGYTYSLNLVLNGTTFAYSGTYITPAGVTGEIEFANDNRSAKPKGTETYFGLFIGPVATGKLVNVTCIDAAGNDLGLQSNKAISIEKDNTVKEPTSYTVDVSGQGSWALTNLKASAGLVKLTYTVASCTVIESGKYSTAYGLLATKTPTVGFPHSGGGMQNTPNGQSLLMQPGYTYSFDIVMNGTTIVYSGTYITPERETGEITFAKLSGSPTGAENYFGLYVGPTIKAKLVNVTCVDARGNDLGLQSNKATYIAPETDAVSYAVAVSEQSSWTLTNLKASTDPVKLTYTVDSYTGTAHETHGTAHGVAVTKVPTGTYPHSNGGLNYTNNANTLMQPGYTYSFDIVTNGTTIGYYGSYIDTNGNIGKIAFAKATGSLSGAETYCGLYVAPTTTAKLVNVTCVDAAGNDLGLQSNRAVDISPETDVTAYTVDVSEKGSLALTNLKASTGPVKLSYTVDSCTVIESGKYSDTYGVLATKTPTVGFPHSGGGMQNTPDGQSLLMQPGYTYSFEIVMSGATISYYGTYITPEGVVGKITFEKLSGTPSGGENYFGLYVGPTITAKLTNVTCVDANGNDLGIQSNKNVTIIHPENIGSNTIASYNVTIGASNTFLCNEEVVGFEEGTEYYMTYTVESVGALPQQLGIIGTEDHTKSYPYVDVGIMKFQYEENAPTLLEVGATYHIRFTVADGDYYYNVYYVKGDEVKSVRFTRSYSEDKDGEANVYDALGYFGLWCGDGTKAVNLTNVSCFDGEGNDLGIWLSESKGVFSTEKIAAEKNAEVSQYYDIEVKDLSNIAIGSVKVPETSKMYMEYKVESADYNLTQEGVLMTTAISGGHPYTKGHLNYNNYKQGNTDSSILLDVGAEYLICVERKETGFTAKVWKTKDGVTSLYIFNSMYKKAWSDDTQLFALWFGDGGDGAIASFKLTNFKCYDDNKNDLGVQCNKAASIIHHVDVDETTINAYNVMIGAVNTFLCNAKAGSSEVGTDYYMSYTVDKATAIPQQLGVIGTEDSSATFPYIEVGIMNFKYEKNALNLLEEGATYHIKFTVTEGGYYYNVVCIKGDEVKTVRFLTPYTVDKDGVKNTYDNLKYFGLWFGDGMEFASLSNVRCFDGEGNDLGIWLKESKGVFSKDKITVKKNTAVQQYYEIEVNELSNLAIGNVRLPEQSKMYMEYKVESAKYKLTQEGMLMTSAISGGHPYTNGHLNYNNYGKEKAITDSSVLLDVGAEYLICVERQGTGFLTKVWKTKDGVTTLHIFASTYKKAWNDEVQFFALWFGDGGDGAITSFKLTNFKCYDENNNNLGVKSNKSISIVPRGAVEDYELCEATYYCESNGAYFELNADQTLKLVKGDTVTEGKYSVSLPSMKVVTDGTKTTYDYLYSKITDSEGQEYMRLYNYKVAFETGTDSKVETQKLSHKNGYFATRPENPAMDDYKFLGWYLSDGTEYNFDKLVTESVTLYAKYSGNGGIIFAAEDEPVVQIIDKGLVLAIAAGAVILLGGCAGCIWMMKRGKKSGRNGKK